MRYIIELSADEYRSVCSAIDREIQAVFQVPKIDADMFKEHKEYLLSARKAFQNVIDIKHD